MVDIDYEISLIDELLEQKKYTVAVSECELLIQKLINEASSNGSLGKACYYFAKVLFYSGNNKSCLDMFSTASDVGYSKYDIFQFIEKKFLEPNKNQALSHYRENISNLANPSQFMQDLDYHDFELEFIPLGGALYYVYSKKAMNFIGNVDFHNDANIEGHPSVPYGDITIYGVWNFYEIYQLAKSYSEYDKRLYIVYEDLTLLLSFLQIADFDENILDKLYIFQNIEDYRKYFEENRCVAKPQSVFPFRSDIAEKIDPVLDNIHEQRLKYENRDESNILLTIAIPTYNSGDEALESIQSLTKMKFDSEIEFLVLDNASTENTEGYAEINLISDSRVKYYKTEERVPLMESVSKIFEKSKGRFVLMLSDRDKVINENLQVCLRSLHENDDLSILSYDSTYQLLEREDNCYYKKGFQATTEIFLRNNYMHGKIYNKNMVIENNLNSLFTAKDAEYLTQNNQAYMNHPSLLMDTLLSKYGDIQISSLSLIDKGITEESVAATPPSTIEYCLQQYSDLTKIIEYIANSEIELIRSMYLKSCNRAFFLVKALKSQFEKDGLEWDNVCSRVFEVCVETMEYLYENIPAEHKVTDKQIIFDCYLGFADKREQLSTHYSKNISNIANSNQFMKKLNHDDFELEFIPLEEDSYCIYSKKIMNFISNIDFKNDTSSEIIQPVPYGDITIYEVWNFYEIYQLADMYSKYGKLVYVICKDLPRLLSFLNVKIFDENILKRIYIFQNIQDYQEYFEKNPSVPKAPIILPSRNEITEKVNLVLDIIHEQRLKYENRDESNILLTIAIPTYNRGQRALESIQSLRKLKFDSEVEFFVIDNASESTDGYAEISAISDSRIKYHKNEENILLLGSMLKLFEEAKGRFILLMSDEDKVINENLQFYLSILHSNKNLAMLACRGTYQLSGRKDDLYYLRGTQAMSEFFLRNNYISGSIYNRHIIMENDLNVLFKEKRKEYSMKNNAAYINYPHMFTDLMMANYGDVQVSSITLINEGIPEESDILLPYTTISSRLQQHKGWARIIEDIADSDVMLTRNMYLKLCNKTFFLLSMVKNYFQEEDLEWCDVCHKVFGVCVEEMEYLYRNIVDEYKNTDKQTILDIYLHFSNS